MLLFYTMRRKAPKKPNKRLQGFIVPLQAGFLPTMQAGKAGFLNCQKITMLKDNLLDLSDNRDGSSPIVELSDNRHMMPGIDRRSRKRHTLFDPAAAGGLEGNRLSALSAPFCDSHKIHECVNQICITPRFSALDHKTSRKIHFSASRLTK